MVQGETTEQKVRVLGAPTNNSLVPFLQSDPHLRLRRCEQERGVEEKVCGGGGRPPLGSQHHHQYNLRL
jgi:hypothetical protein